VQGLPINGVDIYDKSRHSTANCRVIAKFKLQKKACFEAKNGSGKKSLAFVFPLEKVNPFKRQLNPEKLQAVKKN
jgi:hypothetical protein